MIVKNDGQELAKVLQLDAGTLRHCGNFVFKAEKDGQPVTIYTQPVDEEYERIQITGVLAL